ncbi:unnamed protein product, partial [marine sediment metagenome]
TRYKRSFLIGLCEGPASVLRAWKGKKEIPLNDFTIFDGNNNTGMNIIIGKEFANYKNLCCVFFDEYDLGNQDVLPNFQFEVSFIPSYNLVFGGDNTSLTWLDSSLNESINYTIPGGSIAEIVRDVYFQANRKTFAVTEEGYLHLFNKDGIPDTSWGIDGKIFVSEECRGVLVHSNGFIFVTYLSWAVNAPSMSKFTSSGELVWEKQFCAPLTFKQWQNKLIQHGDNIIATCSSNWPEGKYGLGIRTDSDGIELNRYVEVPLK